MKHLVVGWNIVTTIGKFVVLVCFSKFLKACIEKKVANLLVDGTCSMLCEDALNCLINWCVIQDDCKLIGSCYILLVDDYSSNLEMLDIACICTVM